MAATCDWVSVAMQTNLMSVPLGVAAMLVNAAYRMKAEGKHFGNKEHKTEYGPGNHEMKVWYVS
jgi:hypothetical protein